MVKDLPVLDELRLRLSHLILSAIRSWLLAGVTNESLEFQELLIHKQHLYQSWYERNRHRKRRTAVLPRYHKKPIGSYNRILPNLDISKPIRLHVRDE